MRLAALRTALSVLSPPGARGRLTILQFHRVPTDGPDVPSGEMPLSVFERLMDIVAESMHVLPLPEAVRALPRGNLPARAVSLTFDDGYTEWLNNVAPVLLARGLPASFFVTTGQLDGSGMWHERIEQAVAALPATGAALLPGLAGFDDLAQPEHRRQLARLVQEELKYRPLLEREVAIEALEAQATRPLVRAGYFTPEHVRALHAQGFTIGAHTVAHPILRSVSDDDALSEIGQSKETLEGLIGERITLFAYPNGRPAADFDGRHIDMVRRCGYEAAVITGGGVAKRHTSLLELPRFTPWTAHATRTVLQIGSNMLRQAPSAERDRERQRRKVMLVENGAGFGGAIVAAGTLMRHTSPEEVAYHVVTNIPVPGYADIASIRARTVLNDRRFNFRPATRRAYDALPRPLARAVAFALGRMDDVFNRLPYFVALLYLVWKLRPEIIHGNNEPFSNREAMLVAKLLRIPYVQHLRGPYPRVAHIDFLLRQPRAFIPVSRWLAAELRRDQVSPGRVRHVYDGIELSPGSGASTGAGLRASLGLLPSTRVVAMVGMLLPWKGQSLFIDAARRLHADSDDVAFLIVGGLPERADESYPELLRQQGQDLTARGSLHFMGHRRDVTSLMREFDVVVSASLDPEPLGLVMLEGIVAGCEFVGPAHGAAVEATQALSCGVLFKPGDPAALASAIVEALDRRKASAPGAQADVTARVAGLFSPAQCVQLTRRVYASCVSDGGL